MKEYLVFNLDEHQTQFILTISTTEMERTKLVRRQHHHAYHSIPAQSEQIGSRYKDC